VFLTVAMVNAASMAVKSRRADGFAESERHADAAMVKRRVGINIFGGLEVYDQRMLSAHYRTRHKARSEGIGSRCNAESA
jgi:hypothetical protein